MCERESNRERESSRPSSEREREREKEREFSFIAQLYSTILSHTLFTYLINFKHS